MKKTILASLLLATFSTHASEIIAKALTPHLNVHEQIIATTILQESRGEGQRGMYFVAGVIAQRMINRQLHPTTVCRQPRQFSCWNSGKTLKDVKDLLKTKEATYASLLARALFLSYKNDPLINIKYTSHADHYYSKRMMKVPPFWAFTTTWKDGEEIKIPIKPVATVGNHVFYRLKK